MTNDELLELVRMTGDKLTKRVASALTEQTHTTHQLQGQLAQSDAEVNRLVGAIDRLQADTTTEWGVRYVATPYEEQLVDSYTMEGEARRAHGRELELNDLSPAPELVTRTVHAWAVTR